MKRRKDKKRDEEFQELRAEGYTGSINDMLMSSSPETGGSVDDRIKRETPEEEPIIDVEIEIEVGLP